MDRRLTEGGDAVFRGEGTFTMIARVREVFGQMLGCSGSDIAFGPNSSAMFCIFTQGLPFEKGDNIVTSRDTFISMAYALDMLRREGLEVRYVESQNGVVPTQAILDACDGRTRAVALCHVESSTATGTTWPPSEPFAVSTASGWRWTPCIRWVCCRSTWGR